MMGITTMRLWIIFISLNPILTIAEKVQNVRVKERKGQRVIGGEPAPADRYPYYAHYEGRPLCGATLVHEDILIGAAHCCAPSQCGLFLNSIQLRSGGTYVTVEKYVVHPRFNTITSIMGNDIMAMKLTTSAPDDISPIGYNTNSSVPIDNQALTTIGFGHTSFEGESSDLLLQVTLDYVPHDECSEMYNHLDENEMMCAAAEERGSCNGDSGGPLLTNSDGTGEMVGIVSHGIECAKEHPGVYTRVSNYEDWIKEAICCLSSNPPSDCSASSTCSNDFLGYIRSCDPSGRNSCSLLSSVVDSGGGNDNNNCLSPDATTLVENKGKVAIKDIVVGDKVMTASGHYKTVFTTSHSHPNKMTTFLRLHTDIMNENPLEVTPLHMLFVEGNQNPIPAKDVKIGDFVQTLHYGPREVTGVTTITRNGFYNPVTTDGTIVVDGIIASTYTSLNGGSYLEISGMKLISFHSLLDLTISPYRTFCTLVSLDLCSQLGTQDNRPIAVHIMMQFYDFWLERNSLQQLAIFFAYVAFFGVASILLTPIGCFVLATCTIRIIFHNQSKNRKRIS